MNNKEILIKAIKKAIKNGYVIDEIYIKEPCISELIKSFNIFSHEFAKAFFGDNLVVCGTLKDGDDKFRTSFDGAAWEHHLQRMVLEKEPLKYIEQYL